MVFCVVQEIPNTVGMKINDLLGVLVVEKKQKILFVVNMGIMIT